MYRQTCTLQNKANIWEGQNLVYSICCKSKMLKVSFGLTDASCASKFSVLGKAAVESWPSVLAVI